MVRLLDRLDGRAKAEIEAIDRALFEPGTNQNGRCERCGKSIPQSRLEVVLVLAFERVVEETVVFGRCP